MRARRSTCFLLLAFVALGALRPAASRAEMDEWREHFDIPDQNQLYERVMDSTRGGDLSVALPLLETALASRHPHIAVACGDAMRELDAEAVFDERDFERAVEKARRARTLEEQANLARFLGAWGHPLVDEHLGYMASGRRDTTVQSEALFMAGGVAMDEEKQNFPEVRESILKALDKGRSEAVIAAACSAAGRLGLDDEETLDELISVVRTNREEYAGLFAVWALKRLGFDQGVGTFLHVLGHNPKRTTRAACLKAITELAIPDDIPELLSLSRHGDEDYRDAALLALGRMAWRESRKQRLAEEAEAEAVVTGAPAPEPKAEGGCSTSGFRETPFEVPAGVIDRFADAVADEDAWEVRDAARQGLLRSGSQAKAKVEETMPTLVDFSDRDTATTAMELLGLFGIEKALPALLDAALYNDDPVHRMFAMRALEGVDPVGAVEALERHLEPEGRARDVQLRSVRTLGYIRHRKSYDRLIQAFGEDHNDEVVREIELALQRLTGHLFGPKVETWNKWIETAENPLHPSVAKTDRKANREEVVKQAKFGLDRSTERAVERGLRWLEQQQIEMGQWDGAQQGKSFGGVSDCEPAYTGLSLLAFLGAGYDESRGKYRETIRRATEFLTATQLYDGGFPVQGGGDDSWIYAYLTAMGIWGINEAFALSGSEYLAEPSQWGIDYLVRVQTPGAGWRYGPRYVQSDTSCTSWVMMTLKTAQLSCLDVAQRSFDGIDRWLGRCCTDMTQLGAREQIADLASDYEHEVGGSSYYVSYAGYFPLADASSSSLQKVSMTAVAMVCRFFQGWKRSHPFLIGCANYLEGFLPRWMKGLSGHQTLAWYHYYWYYGTLAFHQMGGKYWRKWNEKIKRMYPEEQIREPLELLGSWDPDTAMLNGGRLFSTPMSIMSLETYYRFSPLMTQEQHEDDPN